jgi:hypothetical protein
MVGTKRINQLTGRNTKNDLKETLFALLSSTNKS